MDCTQAPSETLENVTGTNEGAFSFVHSVAQCRGRRASVLTVQLHKSLQFNLKKKKKARLNPANYFEQKWNTFGFINQISIWLSESVWNCKCRVLTFSVLFCDIVITVMPSGYGCDNDNCLWDWIAHCAGIYGEFHTWLHVIFTSFVII